MSDDLPLGSERNGPEYFSGTWGDLVWTGWFSFAGMKEEFRNLPGEPGLYRIRAGGDDSLLYIGETRRPLSARLNGLRQSLRNRDLMPWSDPFTEAPALWALQDAEEISFECSAAPLDASRNGRRGIESLLLARYRQERGGSPSCNFNRFPPQYRSSTNRTGGLRSGRLAAGQQENPAGGPGTPPLPEIGSPGDPDWMGLCWSARELVPQTLPSISPEPGIFVIGQAADCAARLREFCSDCPDSVHVSLSPVPGPVPASHLKELANDLLGNYFSKFRGVPAWQFGRTQ
jgi:hypothetical protein